MYIEKDNILFVHNEREKPFPVYTTHYVTPRSVIILVMKYMSAMCQVRGHFIHMRQILLKG